MLKIVLVMSLLIFAGFAVWRILDSPKPLDDPRTSEAIKDFITKHMFPQELDIPEDVQRWKTQTVIIHSFSDYGTGEGLRLAEVTVKGIYLPNGERNEDNFNRFSHRTSFVVDDTHPNRRTISRVE